MGTVAGDSDSPPGAQGRNLPVCAVPTGAIPAPGTQGSFGVTKSGSTNPAITNTTTTTFTVASGRRRNRSASRHRRPLPRRGTVVQVTLQIQGTGNTATPLTLTATSNPNLTVSGLPGFCQSEPGPDAVQRPDDHTAPGSPTECAAPDYAVTGAFWHESDIDNFIRGDGCGQYSRLELLTAANAAAAVEELISRRTLNGSVHGYYRDLSPPARRLRSRVCRNLRAAISRLRLPATDSYFFEPAFKQGQR